MNRRIRQVLLVLATGAFIVITPAIILYALGFRPTSSRVGVLLLESIPSRAEVFIGDERHGTTPDTISGRGGTIVPIIVQKEGYQPWQKRLQLQTGTTTEARAIRLIPNTLTPEEIISGVSHFTLSPSRILFAAVEGKNLLTVRNTDAETLFPALQLPSTPKSLLWSPDSTLILVAYENGKFDSVSLTEGIRDPLPLTPVSAAEAPVWDPRTPGRLLLLTATGRLAAFDSTDGTTHPLAENIAIFAPSARGILVVTLDGDLQRLTLSGEPLPTPSLPLPKPVRTLLVSPEGSVVLVFTDGSASALLENTLTSLSSAVQSIGFSPDGQLLYLQTAPNELMVYNMSDERLTHIPRRRLNLVTRLSEPISHPQWFAGGQHLIYQLGDQIVLTEIDTRDHAETHILDSTNMSDAAINVGEHGETLFYLKRDPAGTVSLNRTSLILE